MVFTYFGFWSQTDLFNRPKLPVGKVKIDLPNSTNNLTTEIQIVVGLIMQVSLLVLLELFCIVDKVALFFIGHLFISQCFSYERVLSLHEFLELFINTNLLDLSVVSKIFQDSL